MKNFVSQSIPTHKQVIIWLLVFSFLSLTLFSYHYHLNHDSGLTTFDVEAHDHERDIHHGSGQIDIDHQQDSHTVDLSSDITFKPTNIQSPLFALILSLALLLPLYLGGVPQSFTSSNNKLTNHLRFNTPPLRAPPLG